MPTASQRAREQLSQALHQLATSGLSPGSTGNASLRIAEGMLISPTGLACDAISPAQLVVVDEQGQVPAGQLRPSSEWPMHQAIYRAFPAAMGVVHCHSRYATTLASLRKSIPPYHYMIAVAGGDSIPCADYATFGTPELAAAIVRALQNRKACLMANHGQISYGSSVDEALGLALQVEDLAAGYYQCLNLGEPHLLSSAEMQAVLDKFQGYGQQHDATDRRP